MERNVYEWYEYRRSKQPASFTTSADYVALIDLALEIRDFKWAKELYNKKVMKDKYMELKKSWKKGS